jgi:ATP phosphoribosyltransferase
MEIMYLRNSDIPQYLEDGVVDIAIVGENLLVEKQKKLKSFSLWDFQNAVFLWLFRKKLKPMTSPIFREKNCHFLSEYPEKLFIKTIFQQIFTLFQAL